MQNIEKSTVRNSLKYNYISILLNDLLNLEKNTKKEQRQLAKWEEEKDFSILGVLELFTRDIRGYAFQIIENKIENNYKQNILKLQELNIFNISYFNEWYLSENVNYPLLKNYIERLNYLRLLMIEYLLTDIEFG
jgi:hypothetical protein